MEEQERQALITLAVAGSRDALQRLIVEYHGTLCTSITKRIGDEWRRHIDPDDILQDTYTSAFKSIEGCRFDTPAAFYKWLETISLNHFKNKQRSLKTGKRDITRELIDSRHADTSYPDLVHRLAADDATPTRHLKKREATAAVLSSLARLSDDQRDVIRLRFLEGKSVADVASYLGKTPDSVHALCRRGLSALRESLVSISQFLTEL